MPQLTFLPWLKVRKSEKFANVTLVPAPAALAELTGHDKEYASAMTKAYVEVATDKEGNPVPVEMTFVRFNDLSLSAELTDEQFSIAARDLHVLGALVQQPNSQELQPANAYAVVGQRYTEGSFGLAIQSGRLLAGGHKVQGVRFARPTFVPSGCTYRVWDVTMRGACEKLLAQGESPEREALIRALEWYFYAHIETDEQNFLARYVLLMTAFEALLGDPAARKRTFAQTIADQLTTPEDVAVAKTVGAEELTYTEQGWWAYDFYTLRSETVHGADVSPERTRYGGSYHFPLGELAFLLVLRRRLAEAGLIDWHIAGAGLALFLETLRKQPEENEATT